MKCMQQFIEGASKVINATSRCYVIESDKIWIGKSKKFFEVPGGGLQKGEDPKVGAIRECLEEIALQPADVELISINENKTIIEDHDDATTNTHTVYSYKARFGGWDSSTYGGGPEGKLKPHLVPISDLVKHYETNSVYKEWDSAQLQLTINILKFLDPNDNFMF